MSQGSQRWPWLRPILFGIVLVTLPFNWTETTTCQSSPQTHINTGLSLFDGFGETATMLSFTVVMFACLWLASRATPFLRAALHLLSAATCFCILAFVHFFATFSLGDKIRILPAGYVAFGALVLSLVEAAVRFILSLLEAWWGWQERRQKPGAPPTT